MGQLGLQSQQRVRGQRGTAQDQPAEAGQVARFEPGMVDQELGHGRDDEGDHRSLAFDDLEPAPGIERREVQHGHAGLHRVVDEAEAGEREHRGRGQPACSPPVGAPVGHHRHLAVPDGDPFRSPGGARRVHDVGEVVVVDGTWMWSASGLFTSSTSTNPGRSPGRPRSPQPARRASRAAGRRRRVGAADDDRGDLGVLEDALDLGRRQPVVHRHRRSRRACAPRCRRRSSRGSGRPRGRWPPGRPCPPLGPGVPGPGDWTHAPKRRR